MVINQELVNNLLDCLACIELSSHEDLDAYFEEENFEIPKVYLERSEEYARKKFMEIMQEFESEDNKWKIVL